MEKLAHCLSLFIFLLLLTACSTRYDAVEELPAEQYNLYLRQLAPYVLKKPDEISFEERFSSQVVPYYENVIAHTQSEIRYYHKDSVSFFFFTYRDRTSLFEHFRAMGGYFKTDESDSVIFVNIFCHTPRLTSQEMENRGKALFQEMVDRGNVERFIGNRDYIQTPNDDFFYNVAANKWDYTPNSSWKFLQDEQKRYQDSTK